jgi:exodeoxyribonuclease VII small subunit
MSAKKSQPDPRETPVEELTYEQAFTALEEIVARLENEKHPLDQAMALFERGQALARRCATLLEQAELKVQQLTDDGLAPFDARG